MNRTSLALVYLTVLIDMIGFGVVIPLLPFEVMRYHASGSWYGLILTGFSGAQFFGAFAMGRASDRLGRKPILLTSLFGTALGMIFLSHADSLWLLLASRVFGGFFAGSISTAQAYVADVTEPAHRARYMGWVGSCIGLGFILGPAIGGMLAKHGFDVACYFAAGLSTLAFLFGFIALKESHTERSQSRRERFSAKRLWGALSSAPIANIVWAGGLASLAFVAMQTTLPLLGAKTVGMKEQDLAWVFTTLGVIIVIVQGWLVGRLAPRYGERRILLAGFVAMSIGLSMIPFMPTMATLMIGLGLFGFGNALVRPTTASLLSLYSPPDRKGGVLGLGQSMQAGARAIGPLAYGWLYDRDFRAPYGVGIAMAAIAFVLLLIVGSPNDA